MHLGAASMLGTTGANASDNGVPENFDFLTYSNEDLKDVSDLGYTVHNLVVSNPSEVTEEEILNTKRTTMRHNSKRLLTTRFLLCTVSYINHNYYLNTIELH